MQVIITKKGTYRNAYPGRGIVIGKTPEWQICSDRIFIMGRAKTAVTVSL